MSLLNIKTKHLKDKPICIENLTVQYGETSALTDVSLCVEERDYLGIIGPNGGGKTTLLKAILHLVRPTTGQIYVYGKKTGHEEKVIGYVPQMSAVDKKFPITVQQVVLMGMLPSSISLFHHFKPKDIEKANKFLDLVGIYKLKKRMISELSGGEFQKMLIARAIAVEPKILILDEPTASVDANSRNQIFSLLKKLNENMTIILVTHDLLAISSYVKTLACINGRLVYHGDTELTEEVIESLYECPVDLIAHGVPHRVLRGHKEVE